MDLGTVLGIWAHPDDDIYLSAGLMAMNVSLGNRVVDVTATRGEGGSMDEERWPPESMADVRSAELMRSLEVLGVSEHRFLDGPVDIDMDAPLDESGAAQVTEIMAEVQPDTVLTFGPDGMTGHVGHMSVSGWATDAFQAVAKPGARLHYATMTPAYVEVEHLPAGHPPGDPARPALDRSRAPVRSARAQVVIDHAAHQPGPVHLRRGG